MYIQVWRKYVPVIKILLKKLTVADQALEMNGTDFTRAAAGKKVKFTFDIILVNGRLYQADKQPALVKDMVTVLQEDEAAKKLMADREIKFTMSGNFQLKIKETTPAIDTVNNEEAVESDESPA